MPAPSIPGPSGRRFDIDVLLDAAREVFHAEGFALAQIADIARVAGTTKPTLYARLGNKEQIYLLVVRREAHDLSGRVTQAYSAGGGLPLAQLAEVGMEPLFRFARERPAGFELLFRGDAVGVEVAQARRDVVDGVIAQLAALVRRRQREQGDGIGGSAGLIAAACVGLARQVCEQAIYAGEDLGSAQHFAARFAERAIRGLDLEYRTEGRRQKRTHG